MRTVALLAIEDVFDSACSLTCDVLRTARRITAERDGAAPFSVTTTSLDGAPVQSALGQSIPIERVVEGLEPDVLVVPGFWATSEDDVIKRLSAPDIASMLETLARLRTSGCMFGAGCTGTFILAEAGLFESGHATTTWWLADLFRRRYPAVELDVDRMVVRSGRTICSGAAMAHMDLALALVEYLAGPGIADTTGRLLLLDGRPSQAKYMASEQLGGAHAEIIEAERFIHANLNRVFGLDDLAKHLGLSRRTLARRFRKSAGVSPLEFVQRVRMERAIHLLETTDMSIDAVADAVGYSGTAAFRRTFRRETGRAPSDYRRAPRVTTEPSGR